MCTASGEGGFSKGKVLYCYGEVVLQRDLMRNQDDSKAEEEQTEMYFLQISQIVAFVVLILAILLVLLSIRKGLTKIQSQVKHILMTMPENPDEIVLDKQPNCRSNRAWQSKEDGELRDNLYHPDKLESLTSVVSEVH